jgi:hypothetical protein
MQRWVCVKGHPSGQIGFEKIRKKSGYSGHFGGFLKILFRIPMQNEGVEGSGPDSPIQEAP